MGIWRRAKIAALAALTAATLTACGSVLTDDELSNTIFQRGSIYGPNATQDALEHIAEIAGYSDTDAMMIRRLTLRGDNYDISAIVSLPDDPLAYDHITSDSDEASEWGYDGDTYFFPEDLPPILFEDPNVLFKNMRDAVGDQEITGFDVTVRPEVGAIEYRDFTEETGEEMMHSPGVTLEGSVTGTRRINISFKFDPDTGEIIAQE